MSKNPNIAGKDLESVQQRTGEAWRYKFQQMGDMKWPIRENFYSDNDDHLITFPVPEPVRRK
jgi:hypothetical protein